MRRQAQGDFAPAYEDVGMMVSGFGIQRDFIDEGDACGVDPTDRRIGFAGL